VQDETLVNAADIARLADVGRSAVSNWRRRYPGFPQPVGGTPAGPLFALAEVEAWLRHQGKLLEVPLAERAWQQLRSRAGDDLHLAASLADVGELLVTAGVSRTGEAVHGSLAVAELAMALGPADAFEVLFGRLQEVQGRSASATSAEIAELMAALPATELAEAETAAVLDPACGTGELLLAARDNGAQRLFGQDVATEAVRLAGVRLRLGHDDRAADDEQDRIDVTLRAGDALTEDAFAGVIADVVMANLTLGKRGGTADVDPGDARWVYGVPPRLEPELGWVQHMLAHLSPGGLAVALLPAAAAGRRPGRRIRAQLLRRGALRAVVALPGTQHLWLLRQPSAPAPASVLMVASGDPDAVLGAWRRFGADDSLDEPGVSRGVPIIDLLDDEVDLTPGRHVSAPPADDAAERFAEAKDRLTAAIDGLGRLAPDMGAASEPRQFAFVTVAELARTGHLKVLRAPTRADFGSGENALLTAEDLAAGRPPSGRVAADPRWITVCPGDIVVSAGGGRFTARVWATDEAILGTGLTVVRVDQTRLDPYFVCGALRSSPNARVSMAQTGSQGRTDVLRARIPRLPLPEQHGFGDAFRRVDELRSAVRSASDESDQLAQLLSDGVTNGSFNPVTGASSELPQIP
jgi:SAM-dependent methyltransferase